MSIYGVSGSSYLNAINEIYNDNSSRNLEYWRIDQSTFLNLMGFANLPQNSSELFNRGSEDTSIYYNFWESKSKDYYVQLGENFTNYSEINQYQSSVAIQKTNNSNLVNTYIIYLMFGEFFTFDPTSATFGPTYNFTSSIPPLASMNLRVFIRYSGGLGNIGFDSSGKTDNNKINQGIVSTLCNNYYGEYCAEKNLPQTGEQCINSYKQHLSQTPHLLNWCGCFAPVPSIITNNIKKSSNNNSLTSDNGLTACNGTCRPPSPIKLYIEPGSEGNQGRVIECNAAVCIIDNIKINSLNSQSTVNFNQVCSCIQGQPCLCFIESDTPGLLDNVSSGAGGLNTNVDLNQRCGPNSICYKIDPETQKTTQIPCNPINTPKTGSVFTKNTPGMSLVKNYSQVGSGFWLVFISISLILTICIICFIFLKIF